MCVYLLDMIFSSESSIKKQKKQVVVLILMLKYNTIILIFENRYNIFLFHCLNGKSEIKKSFDFHIVLSTVYISATKRNKINTFFISEPRCGFLQDKSHTCRISSVPDSLANSFVKTYMVKSATEW